MRLWRKQQPQPSLRVEPTLMRSPQNGGDEALRRQCLQWAFQTRDFTDAPHSQVLDVARRYYEFIKG